MSPGCKENVPVKHVFLPLIPNYISDYLTILLWSVGYRFYTPGVWCDIEGLANKTNQHLFQFSYATPLNI